MNQVAAYKKSFIGRPYGPDGCQVQTTQGRCGETRNLNIINDFQQLYELKLSEIDADGGGDETKAKIELMESWIRDLTEQNRLLIRTVEELEIEATERVQILEDKLREHAKCLCEKTFYLENDISNLLEFIRRIREDNVWSIQGLLFFEVSYEDLFGDDEENSSCGCDESVSDVSVPTAKPSINISFEVIESSSGECCKRKRSPRRTCDCFNT